MKSSVSINYHPDSDAEFYHETMPVSCRTQVTPSFGPHPVLEIGPVTIYPNMEQLKLIRDTITAYLDNEAAAEYSAQKDLDKATEGYAAYLDSLPL